MKKFKKACGKGGGGLVNLATAAVKTVVNSPLSESEKQTMREFRGDESPPAIVEVQTYVVQSETKIVYVRPEVAAAAEPPPYDAVIGAAAHHLD